MLAGASGPLRRSDGGGDIAYLRDVLALRAGGPWHFELLAMHGIVTMPSYHTVMAVLFTYAFRRTGLIGYGIATLNLVMLLSIPPIGGHYLVDMCGGALALEQSPSSERVAWSEAIDCPRLETLSSKASK